VYTVFAVNKTPDGMMAFRLPEHFRRLSESAHIIGIDTFQKEWTYERFEQAAKTLIRENQVQEDVLVRATVHVTSLLPGTRSRGLDVSVSLFVYPAQPILPLDGARIKSSVWRRVPDNAIPARAKVNGAYVNSVLAKQDALNSGYDDCVFLDGAGNVCELSAANIFIVREGVLVTPGVTSDLLEGINRRTILELAQQRAIKTAERAVNLTELYIADEIFACGTSAFVAPIVEVDARKIGTGQPGTITQKIAKLHFAVLHGKSPDNAHLLTELD
jgi:branched-chain amino acid aminotransferase